MLEEYIRQRRQDRPVLLMTHIVVGYPSFEASRRMVDDMVINAGRILEGATIEEVGREIFEEVIAVAGGKKTKSEAQGIGDEEFCPWTWGPMT